MKRILLASILFFTYSAYSQQSKIDSLSELFHASKIDTTKIHLLAKVGATAYYLDRELAVKINDSLIRYSKGKSEKFLGAGYRMRGTLQLLNGDYENSEKNYLKALALFKKVRNKHLEGDLYSNLGTFYGRKGDVKTSSNYYLKTVKINDSLAMKHSNVNPYMNLGINAEKMNNIEESSNYYIKVMELAEKYNDSLYLTYAHSYLAKNYLQIEAFEKAKKHLSKALVIAEKKENNFSLADIHNSFGYFYETRDDNYIKALYHYDKSLFYNRLINNKIEVIISLGNVGLQHIRLGRYLQAEKSLENCLGLSDSINSQRGKIIGNLHLAYLSIQKGELAKSKKIYNTAKLLLGNSSRISYKSHFYRLATAYENKGEYDFAYKNMKDYTILADSLFKKNSIDKIAEVETKYQTEKKEKENLQLKADKVTQELQLEKENKRKWYFVFAFLAALLSLGVFTFYYRRNQKQKTIIENLQKDLHHRVKNNLTIIDSLIEDIKDEFDNKAFSSKLTDLQNRIDSINEVHSQLYMNTDITNLKLNKYVEKLAKNVQQSFAKENIIIKQNIHDSLSLNVDKSFPVGLIINEFITNSFKYAFPNNGEGIVNISIQEKPDNYIMSLSDNGKGLAKDFDISKLDSFGMDIMRLLSKQLQGTFTLDGTSGVHIIIKFPKG